MICEQYKTNDNLEKTNEKLEQIITELTILNKSVAEIGWQVLASAGYLNTANPFVGDWRKRHAKRSR
jgi:hypothetical protein